MEITFYLSGVSSNGLKDSERDLGALKMVQDVGSRQLLKLREQLQKLKLWPETVKRP
jgi:hypothetical protein